MTSQAIGNEELWRNYRAEFSGEQLRSLKVAILSLVVTVGVAFLFVDAYVHPARFWSLAETRIVMTAALGATWLGLNRSRPRLSAVLGSLLLCLMILTLIYETGGASSNYFAGLMLCFASIPVVLPLSALETSAVVVPTLIGFLVSPWLSDVVPTWNAFGLNSFYLGSSALVAVVSAAMLDRGRFAEFRRRREAEQARDELRELDRAKSRFTANVHHELRTPLTLLLAPLEAMRAGEFGPLSALQQRALATMYANSARLLKLLGSVLDLAKHEAGELRLRRRRTDLGLLAARVVEAARPLAERKRVALVAHGLETLPSLAVDRDALDQVLVNLIGNALKFTEAGGRVELRTRLHEDAVDLVVADTGLGLAPEDLERVFERFAQVDDSTTRRFEGTGIGLAIAREQVEAHGGSIWAESDGLGHGTSLHVRLPRGAEPLEADSHEPEIGPESESALARSFAALEAELDLGPAAAPSGATLASETGSPGPAAEVLVVEDNGAVRRLLARILGREFRVRTACNGAEALTAVEAALPDLVLADVMMPEMSGTELCRRLKQSERARGIPVILLTAKADRDSRIEGLERGAEEYLPKPFSPRELLARIRALVKLRMLSRELEAANAALGTSRRNLALYARAVSHDLRSPLAAAAEALRLVRARSTGQPREFLALAEENLARADRMLGALRELTRTVGAAEAPQLIDVGRLLVEVRDELVLARGGTPPLVHVTSSLGTLVAPREKLAHVFRNLLRNALEALDGTAAPRVEVGRLSGEEPCFFVRDNGPGIPYEYQARLFEPFRRGPRARPENMGLGLALVHQLVEQQSGKLWLDSTPGHGTAFRFTWPEVPESVHVRS